MDAQEIARPILRGLQQHRELRGGGGGWASLIYPIVIVMVLAFAISYHDIKHFHKRRKLATKEGFEEEVANAKAKSQGKFTPGKPFVPYEGEFNIKYHQTSTLTCVICMLVRIIVSIFCCCCCPPCKKKCEPDKESNMGTFKVRMTNNGATGTYKPEGSRTDDEGCSTIVDGSADIAGNAWWLEERDNKVKVLSEGKFDYLAQTFTGSWYASDGRYGNYHEFVEKNGPRIEMSSNESKTMAEEVENSHTDTLQNILQEDLPKEQPSTVAVPTLYVGHPDDSK